jgi:ribose transport system substrate-binding protein
MQRRHWLSGLTALALTAACKKGPTDSSGPSAGDSGRKIRIAVVPKGTTHEFWKSVHAGAVKASREFNVDAVWKGPLKEDDLRQQIELVQSFTAQQVAGIVIAPLSDRALIGPVKAAQAAGVPVVVFDSDLQSDVPVSFVATDNFAAGKLAGEHMSKVLNGRGNVVVLRYLEGSASTTHRERGFIEAVRAHPDLRLVSDNQYAGATTESAFTTSENLLAAHKAQSGGVDGVFAPNESSTFGMLLALRKIGMAGKIRFVGFDASDKLIGGVREGHLDALVLQDPFKMGYLAVKTMCQHILGQVVEKRLDTGATLATRDVLDTPAVRALIQPDLRTWLGE